MRVARLYASVAVNSFRRYATYRVATAAGVFTNTVFGFIVAATFVALWSERPHLGGYTQSQALTYVWTGQALLSAVALLGGSAQEELQARIRTGDVAVDLYRPVDLQLWWLAADLGRAAFHLLGRGVVPMAVGALAFDLTLPTDPWTWAVFGVSVWLAVTLGFAVHYLLALTTFWLLDGDGLNTVGGLIGVFFSGLLLPLNVFPGAIGEVARALPWAGMLQVPADVLLGETGAVRALVFQAAWTAVLLTAGRLLQSAATRRVVVQGG